MMRFKTDENIHPHVAGLLRRQGYDAVTVWEQGLRGASDARIIDACRHEGRSLFTTDLDFADVRTIRLEPSVGTIVLQLARQDRTKVVEAIERTLPLLATGPLCQHVWIVDDFRIRIRGAAPHDE